MAPKAVSRVRAKKAGESVPPPTIESVSPPTLERGTSSRSKRKTRASRGGGNNTKRKEPSIPEEGFFFAWDAESGDDSDDAVEVQDDIDLARAKALSDEKFIRLNSFLIECGMDAGQPYKDAIRKLLQRQVTDSRVREHIVEYIRYKLTAFQKYLSALLVDHWDGEVAFEIANLIQNELIEHLEVEVAEVKEIYQVAEEACKESSERLQLARSGFLKNRVRSWLINTEKLGETLKKWVKNPTASFSSCDEPYNYKYDRPDKNLLKDCSCFF